MNVPQGTRARQSSNLRQTSFCVPSCPYSWIADTCAARVRASDSTSG